MIHKIADLCQRAFNDVAAAFVGGKPLTNRVRDIAASTGELSQKSDFLPVLREKQVDHATVVARHGEDVAAALQQFLGDRLAAEGSQVDTQLGEGRDSRLAGSGSFGGVHSSREDVDILSVLEEITHQALRHRAPADISGADKEDRLHDSRASLVLWNVIVSA